MKYLAISGSLRKASLNTALLKATEHLLPEATRMEIATLENLPILNPDDLESGFPQVVNELANKIKQADALVLATPEFNYSVTAALKNAIDWLSIHPDAPLKHKPTAIMSAGPGLFGGARAQYQLRQILIYPDAKLLNVPEVMVGGADKFNDQGELVDAQSKELIRQQMIALHKLI